MFTNGHRSYQSFIDAKAQAVHGGGFEPLWMPDMLFDFQKALVEWSLLRGRSAIFADCGLGKTPMQLVWAENVVRKTSKPVLIATPLAVSYQTLREAEKFGVEAARSSDGTIPGKAQVVITNYERLDRFDPADFAGAVYDESSILKSFNGVRKSLCIEFMRRLPYRLLCTATAAPNDYVELGNSSEALGHLGFMDMLTRFFKAENNVSAERRMYGSQGKFRFKGHAEEPFWKWVCSWARAVRKPSDMGFDDGPFILPELIERNHTVKTDKAREGMLFPLPAIGLKEQREERRITIEERCGRVADLVKGSDRALIWCHLNAEGDFLERSIEGAVQVAGSDSDEKKEERLLAFADGQIRFLVTKPKIGAWGLNLQNCAHVTFFPSHSYEQYYQGVRRCWRFGQNRPVTIDVLASEGDAPVIANLKRKSSQADRMFTELVRHMNESEKLSRSNYQSFQAEVPAWMTSK